VVAIGEVAAEAGTASEIADKAVAVAMTGVRGVRVDGIAIGADVGDESEKF